MSCVSINRDGALQGICDLLLVVNVWDVVHGLEMGAVQRFVACL